MREPQTRELNTKELNTRGLSTRAPAHHPESVVTTFSLAFERVEKISKEAADVLRLCAFLAPDAIPETLIHIEQWKLNEACQVLLKFSLIRRDENTPTATTGTLTAKIPTVGIHRLVQAVLRDSMDEPTRRRWAFQAIKNVSTAFPTTIEVSAWPACQLLLPHVQICSRFIAVHKFRAPRLLTSAGWYLFQRAQYREAEPLYNQARSILEQMHTPNDLDLAQVQHRLGELYERLGWSALAEEELRQALDIRRRSLGSDAPEIAATLMSLARVYRNRSKYSQAEPLYTEAQSIYERALIDSNRKYGVRHPITDQCMDNLAKLYDEMATLYRKQKRYDDAGRLYDRALDISQQLFGKNHPFTAQIYHNQAELYKDQGDLQEAKRWHQEALKIRRQYFGDKNPETATSLHSLAGVYAQQGKREEAEQCYQDALDIRRKDLGAESSETAETMFGLAELYRNWGKEREAERYYLETLLIWETVPGQGSQSTFDCQRALANLYESQGRLREAERLYKKALSNRYEKLRPHDPTIQQNIECLAKLYERQNKEKDLAELYEEAFEKRARRLGIDHPATEQYWTLLIQFYRKQVNEQDVQHLYEKAFNMRVRSLRGDDRTSVERFAHTVQYLAGLYRKQGQESYLRSLYEQAAEICHERLGRLAPLTLGYLDALARISDQDIIPLPVGRTHGLTVPLRGTPPGGIVEPGKPADFQGDLKLKMAQQEEQKLKEELKKHYRERGVGDPATIQCRHELAKLYEKRNKLKEAEYVYKEALFRCSHDTKLGPEHPTTIECQNDLAKCYWSHRKYEEAKSIIRDALDSCELVLETTTLSQELTPIVAHSLDNAALYYKWRGLREKAESLLQRALALCEQVLGEEHSETVNIREHYTDLLEDETQRRLLL